MQQFILIIHVLTAISLVALVLVQHGKGADMGAAFGSGASRTMFGSQGSTPFLVKVTGFLAVIFFVTSLGLAYLASKQIKQPSVLTSPSPITQTLPPQGQSDATKPSTKPETTQPAS